MPISHRFVAIFYILVVTRFFLQLRLVLIFRKRESGLFHREATVVRLCNLRALIGFFNHQHALGTRHELTLVRFIHGKLGQLPVQVVHTQAYRSTILVDNLAIWVHDQLRTHV